MGLRSAGLAVDSVVDRGTGFTAVSGSAHALVEKLALLVADHGLRDIMGSKAQARVPESFDTTRVWSPIQQFDADCFCASNRSKTVSSMSDE